MQVDPRTEDVPATTPIAVLRALVETRLARPLQFAPTKQKCLVLLKTTDVRDLWKAATHSAASDQRPPPSALLSDA